MTARPAWDARFFIAIFPDGQWCKIHAFSGGKSLEKHCLSALEGLDGAPQNVALVGSASIDRREARATFDGASITARGVTATVDARDRFHWIRAPRVLTYHSAWGPARVTVDGHARDAFGVLEHAFGAQTRLDVARLAPRRWQWDVLSLEGSPEATSCFFAGLTLFGHGFHGVARLARDAPTTHVDFIRIRTGDPGRAWSGAMRTRRGTLRYEARAATPVAPEVDGGGFVGFTWQGDFNGARAHGSGFSEFRSAD